MSIMFCMDLYKDIKWRQINIRNSVRTIKLYGLKLLRFYKEARDLH